MFSLVFISNDSQRQDIAPGTPFLVIGPKELKAECRDFMRRESSASDFESVGSDESGPILWQGTTYHKSRRIQTRVHLVMTSRIPK